MNTTKNQYTGTIKKVNAILKEDDIDVTPVELDSIYEMEYEPSTDTFTIAHGDSSYAWLRMGLINDAELKDELFALLDYLKKIDQLEYAKGGSIWKNLDMNNIEEYFDYIADSYINGQFSQVKDLYNKMSEDQQKEFFKYAAQFEKFADDKTYMADTVEYINKNVRSYKQGGTVENLEKELHKLQRELNSHRLITYIEGDNSDEAIARKKERAIKLARFNEVLALLREMDSKKYATGGSIRNHSRDMMFKSQEPHEQQYKRQKDWKEYNTSHSSGLGLFKDGGAVAPANVLEYLQTLNVAALPKSAADYLRDELLTADNLSLLSLDNTDVQTMQNLIAERFAQALPQPEVIEEEPAAEETEIYIPAEEEEFETSPVQEAIAAHEPEVPEALQQFVKEAQDVVDYLDLVEKPKEKKKFVQELNDVIAYVEMENEAVGAWLKTKYASVLETQKEIIGATKSEAKKLADKLMTVGSGIYDKLKIESGSQLYADIEMQKKYKAGLDKEFGKMLAGKIISPLVYEILENANYHDLNAYLAMSGYFGADYEASHRRLGSGEHKTVLSASLYEQGGAVGDYNESDYEDSASAIEGEFSNEKIDDAYTKEDVEKLAAIVHELREKYDNPLDVWEHNKVQDYLTNLAAGYKNKKKNALAPFSIYGEGGEWFIKDTKDQHTVPSSTTMHWTGKSNKFSSKAAAVKALQKMLDKMHKEQPAYNMKWRVQKDGSLQWIDTDYMEQGGEVATEKFGAFLYGKEGEEPVISLYFSNAQDAEDAAADLERQEEPGQYTEVWEKDKDGLFGNSGLPVWASKGSGYYEKVRFEKGGKVKDDEALSEILTTKSYNSIDEIINDETLVPGVFREDGKAITIKSDLGVHKFKWTGGQDGKLVKFEKGGKVNPSDGSKFNADVSSWFDELVEFSKTNREAVAELTAQSLKSATRQNLRAFIKMVNSSKLPAGLISKLRKQLNRIQTSKYKDEFKNAFGGKIKSGDTYSSAAKEFYSMFEQAATYPA